MKVYDIIVECYKPGHIIFTSELQKICEGKIKEATVRKQIERLVDKSELIKIANGVYAIPERSSLEECVMIIDVNKVIEKKYLKDDREVKGYYSGLTLLSRLGICNQMPNIKEIVTNNESSRKRTVQISKRKVIIRKSRVKVNKDNVYTLQFLELMRIIDDYRDCSKEWAKEVIVEEYKGKVSWEKIEQYIKYFPSKVAKKMMEYKVYELFA